MPRNIEIKARIDDVERALQRARNVAGEAPTLLLQDDTFFNCANGRLKLRILSDSAGELIFYQRPDTSKPRASDYTVVPTAHPRLLLTALTRVIGVRGRVRKRRWLFAAGRTRIHVDEVEGLGPFLELEVVLCDDDRLGDGIAEARRLMRELGVPEDTLVGGAYVDLLPTREGHAG
ncbi:MAG: class IV adenylate cyclase [Candidatus Eisenbacteria bacterium]|jgi:adenylate cyclase|nr:class IV adenylate cyclase [Candidatus Eisenbacteria bacterium]